MAWFSPPAVRLFMRDQWIRLAFVPALLLPLITAAVVLRLFPRQENAVLHYNTYFGIDLVGAWYQIFYLPLVSLAVALLNGVVALFVWRRDRVQSYLIAVGTVALSTAVTAAAGFIIYVNR